MPSSGLVQDAVEILHGYPRGGHSRCILSQSRAISVQVFFCFFFVCLFVCLFVFSPGLLMTKVIGPLEGILLFFNSFTNFSVVKLGCGVGKLGLG